MVALEVGGSKLTCEIPPPIEAARSFPPGYYNGEGQNTGVGFVGTQYPQGAPSFFKMLARWREQGDLAGLVVK